MKGVKIKPYKYRITGCSGEGYPRVALRHFIVISAAMTGLLCLKRDGFTSLQLEERRKDGWRVIKESHKKYRIAMSELMLRRRGFFNLRKE